MDTKARYTLVGLFILTFTIAMVAFVLWLARYDVNKDKLKEYRLYVKDSIAGLNVNSIVYYKGIDVGLVDVIQINPKNLEEIEIILKISKPELIKTDTVAIIESQGVTGNKTIELSGGTQSAARLTPNESGYATIPIKQSFLTQLTSQAGGITTKVDTVLEKFLTVLNEKNLKSLENILQNTDKSTENLTKFMTDLNATINNLNGVVNNNVKNSLESFDNLINNEIKSSLKRMDALTIEMSKVGTGVNELIEKDIKNTLNEFKVTTQKAQNIDEVLIGFEQTLEKINLTLEEFNQNGGDMIFKTRQIKYGPGE